MISGGKNAIEKVAMAFRTSGGEDFYPLSQMGPGVPSAPQQQPMPAGYTPGIQPYTPGVTPPPGTPTYGTPIPGVPGHEWIQPLYTPAPSPQAPAPAPGPAVTVYEAPFPAPSADEWFIPLHTPQGMGPGIPSGPQGYGYQAYPQGLLPVPEEEEWEEEPYYGAYSGIDFGLKEISWSLQEGEDEEPLPFVPWKPQEWDPDKEKKDFQTEYKILARNYRLLDLCLEMLNKYNSYIAWAESTSKVRPLKEEELEYLDLCWQEKEFWENKAVIPRSRIDYYEPRMYDFKNRLKEEFAELYVKPVVFDQMAEDLGMTMDELKEYKKDHPDEFKDLFRRTLDRIVLFDDYNPWDGFYDFFYYVLRCDLAMPIRYSY